MNFKFWLRSIATHLIVGAALFFVGRFTTPAPETVTINLKESEKQQIVQDARLGWITLDSAKALVISESKIKWIPTPKYYDSLRVKDSLNIIDSVVYIPVYTAADTTIQFDDTTETATVSLAIRLKQRFFPLQERFASELKLMSLTVKVPEVKKRESGKYMIGLGMGARFDNAYFFGDFTYKLVNTEYFEIPVALRMEYNINKVLSGGIETKLQVKF